MTLHFATIGLAPELVPYRPALALQEAVHAEVAAGTRGNTVLFVEHEDVYTAGRQSLTAECPFDGTEVVPVRRGGKITYHGPGMLVGYPIVRLATPVDPVRVVRELEQLLIAVAAEFGVEASTVTGRSGAWVHADGRGPERKLAAIGLQVSRRVLMHGFALNCDPDLRPFGRIIPCGITDASVTSLSAELGRPVSPAEVLPVVEREFRAREELLCAPSDLPPVPLPEVPGLRASVESGSLVGPASSSQPSPPSAKP